MSCESCNCVIGRTYTLVHGICVDCGNQLGGDLGEYRGMKGDAHVFRLHPVRICEVCGNEHKLVKIRCERLIDVTEEFNVMFHRKDSHWVGGSNKIIAKEYGINPATVSRIQLGQRRKAG